MFNWKVYHPHERAVFCSRFVQRFWINIRRIFSRSVSTVKIRTAFVSFRLLLLAVSFQETKFLKSKIRSALSARSKRLMYITRF